jgi:uncharacterized protein YdeI (YjbR/CyaY-like superfamily)
MPRSTSNDAIYFDSPAAFRRWLERHHASSTELLVGFHKRHTGHPTLTWPESVDEALCFGWIDGIRRSVDADRYTIRFTPRKASSNWSAVNIRRAEALIADGRMQPAGLRAFEARRADRSAVYSFEQSRQPDLSDAEKRRVRANRKAWTFFEAQPPGYRRTITHWVVSAKRDATRAKRLDTLISDSASGLRVGLLRRP